MISSYGVSWKIMLTMNKLRNVKNFIFYKQKVHSADKVLSMNSYQVRFKIRNKFLLLNSIINAANNIQGVVNEIE